MTGSSPFPTYTPTISFHFISIIQNVYKTRAYTYFNNDYKSFAVIYNTHILTKSQDCVNNKKF